MSTDDYIDETPTDAERLADAGKIIERLREKLMIESDAHDGAAAELEQVKAANAKLTRQVEAARVALDGLLTVIRNDAHRVHEPCCLCDWCTALDMARGTYAALSTETTKQWHLYT